MRECECECVCRCGYVEQLMAAVGQKAGVRVCAMLFAGARMVVNDCFEAFLSSYQLSIYTLHVYFQPHWLGATCDVAAPSNSTSSKCVPGSTLPRHTEGSTAPGVCVCVCVFAPVLKLGVLYGSNGPRHMLVRRLLQVLIWNLKVLYIYL